MFLGVLVLLLSFLQAQSRGVGVPMIGASLSTNCAVQF